MTRYKINFLKDRIEIIDFLDKIKIEYLYEDINYLITKTQLKIPERFYINNYDKGKKYGVLVKNHDFIICNWEIGYCICIPRIYNYQLLDDFYNIEIKDEKNKKDEEELTPPKKIMKFDYDKKEDKKEKIIDYDYINFEDNKKFNSATLKKMRLEELLNDKDFWEKCYKHWEEIKLKEIQNKRKIRITDILLDYPLDEVESIYYIYENNDFKDFIKLSKEIYKNNDYIYTKYFDIKIIQEKYKINDEKYNKIIYFINNYGAKIFKLKEEEEEKKNLMVDD